MQCNSLLGMFVNGVFERQLYLWLLPLSMYMDIILFVKGSQH